MITISTALPIHFWYNSETTFNESKPAFIMKRPYYHELLDSVIQKLQLTDTDNNTYTLYFYDTDNKLITTKQFVKTAIAGLNVYDLEFTFATLPIAISDKRVRMYMVQNAETFDDTFDDTFNSSNFVGKSDFCDVKSAVDNNMGWGYSLVNYKSLSNYYGIQYPNNDNYFVLQIPARFYHERIQETLNEIQLSDTVLATSRTQKFQKYLEPYQLPYYMLKKLSAVLSHDVTGSVTIDDIEQEVADSFDWSPIDSKAPLAKGKGWLTDKNNFKRNII